MTATPATSLSLLAPGAQVVVRDEQWLIRAVQQTRADGLMVKTIGASELVRDQEATFFTALDNVQPLRPEDTKLVTDPSPGFRLSRLYLEALLRKTPLPTSDTRLAVGHLQLLDELEFQKRPAQLALEALRPRLLIADAVGLGKTLEVGIILSELIRRGRGDRILVVAPRHILEQFQHEMWTRFAIPLVRLDSEGIQKVRQKIPATRNPFTFYKRAIISIDTLKNAGRYRYHLENIRWDAVVIDECHNLINRGTLNNQLARVLAPRTDALILTSATPHNGKAESFAELVRMLDPTAVADPKNYDASDIAHLYVRRHKADPEVSAEVGSEWADRKPPEAIHAQATDAENAVFDELATTWLYPKSGAAPSSGKGKTLFPYTLLKAFLSSHRALLATIENRRKTIARAAAEQGRALSSVELAEDSALIQLAELTEVVNEKTSAKLAKLVEELKKIGVGKNSPTRAVIFSERWATLEWLQQVLPSLLGMKPDAIRIMHGGLGDQQQQEIVEEFALADTEVRLLITGDIASEGVNLHRQCHQLIHFDLPWSLITIEQRNGRIDRYGQRHSPEIRALLLTPENERVRGDLTIVAKLLEKEHEAHKALGDAASIMGLHSAAAEEDAILRAIVERRQSDEVIPDKPRNDFDIMMIIAGGSGAEPVATTRPLSLFDSDEAFLNEALREAYDDPESELDIRRDKAASLISFVPPSDLKRRFMNLPQTYLVEQKIFERLKLTSDRVVADKMLEQAREKSKSDSLWPEVAYLSSQHPVLEWLTDKVLVRLGRNEAPVLIASVGEPTFLFQGVFSNIKGQPTIVEWIAVDGIKQEEPRIRPMGEALPEAGVDPQMVNPGHDLDLESLSLMIPKALEAARTHMQELLESRSETLDEQLDHYSRRLESWKERAEEIASGLPAPQRKKHERNIADQVADAEARIQSLRTVGDPLIRVVAVLVGAP
jgi:ERCC4-related helicase